MQFYANEIFRNIQRISIIVWGNGKATWLPQRLITPYSPLKQRLPACLNKVCHDGGVLQLCWIRNARKLLLANGLPEHRSHRQLNTPIPTPIPASWFMKQEAWRQEYSCISLVKPANCYGYATLVSITVKNGRRPPLHRLWARSTENHKIQSFGTLRALPKYPHRSITKTTPDMIVEG